MPQTNPREFTDLLEVFRLGLLTQVIAPSTVIAWADALIEADTEPAYFIIELALSNNRHPNDLIGLLDEYVGPDKPDVAKRVLLGHLLHLYRAKQVSFERVVQTIDWLVVHIDFPSEEHSAMAGIDDEYHLVAEGIRGTFAEIEAYTLGRLAIYQDFTLENRDS